MEKQGTYKVLDYYSFGSAMSSRSFTGTFGYKFGFNSYEKDNEINGNHLDFDGFGYDTRLGRRWNIDLMVKPWESGYATFKDNPIKYSDPNGLDPRKRAEKYAKRKGIENYKLDNFKNGIL